MPSVNPLQTPISVSFLNNHFFKITDLEKGTGVISQYIQDRGGNYTLKSSSINGKIYNMGDSICFKWEFYLPPCGTNSLYIVDCTRSYGDRFLFHEMFFGVKEQLNKHELLLDKQFLSGKHQCKKNNQLRTSSIDKSNIKETIDQFFKMIDGSYEESKLCALCGLTTIICQDPKSVRYFKLSSIDRLVDCIWNNNVEIQRCAMTLLVKACQYSENITDTCKYIAEKLMLGHETEWYSISNEKRLQNIILCTHYKRMNTAEFTRTLVQLIKPFIRYPERFV